MSSSLGTVLLTAVLGAGPFGFGGAGCSTCGSDYGYYGGGPVTSYAGGGFVGGGYDVGAYGSGGSSDQLYPYDAPDPWMHGYFQNMPAYGGFQYFRPYNYKHALSQSSTAGRWGMSPVMPYSQQFWHRYQDKASLSQQTSRDAQTDYANEYAREYARLRAWQDYQAAQQGPAYAARPSAAVPPRPGMVASTPPPRSPAVPDPRQLGNAAAGYGNNTWSNRPNGSTLPNPSGLPSAGYARNDQFNGSGTFWSGGAAMNYPQTPAYRVPSTTVPRVVDVPPPPGRLNPAGYRSPTEIEQLHQQLQQQAAQIQALQYSLQQQSYQPPQWTAPPRR